jgi:hypothetical protein
MTEIQALEQNLDISRIIMFITILVSLTSIVFGSLSMAFERSHNVKSVRPLFNLHPSISGSVLSLSIANAGLGPMLISRITLVAKGEASASLPARRIADVLPSDLKYEASFGYPGEYVLAANDRLDLVRFTAAGPQAAEQLAGLKEILTSYALEIDYQDVYEHDYRRRAEIMF